MSDKAIFLDRDGTLIEDPGYLNDPEQVKLLEGVAEALAELRTMGYKLIVVSNQSAVARGLVTEKVLDEIHNRLNQLLAAKQVHLDRIYYCPYHPDGVIGKYRKDSDLRKPNPGMLLTAADEIDIDLSDSWLIGNSNSDIEAGLRAGCKTILINRSLDYKQSQPNQPSPDYKGVNIKEAVNIIKKHHRRRPRPEDPPQTPAAPQPQSTVPGTPDGGRLTAPQSQTEQPSNQVTPQEQQIHDDKSQQLLSDILGQLKKTQREDMFDDFSIMKLMANTVQVIVLLCLVVSIWFLLSPTRRDSSVLISLGFAMVLQLMSLTFYIMQRQK